MKKVAPVAVLFLCFFVFACKKDRNVAPNVSIIGKWKIDSSHMAFYGKNNEPAGVSFSSGGNDTIAFNKDGSVLGIWPFNKKDRVTYVINNNGGQKSILLNAINQFDEKLTVTYIIATLTEHQLKLTTIIPPDTLAVQPNYIKAVAEINLSR